MVPIQSPLVFSTRVSVPMTQSTFSREGLLSVQVITETSLNCVCSFIHLDAVYVRWLFLVMVSGSASIFLQENSSGSDIFHLLFCNAGITIPRSCFYVPFFQGSWGRKICQRFSPDDRFSSFQDYIHMDGEFYSLLNTQGGFTIILKFKYWFKAINEFVQFSLSETSQGNKQSLGFLNLSCARSLLCKPFQFVHDWLFVACGDEFQFYGLLERSHLVEVVSDLFNDRKQSNTYPLNRSASYLMMYDSDIIFPKHIISSKVSLTSYIHPGTFRRFVIPS